MLMKKMNKEERETKEKKGKMFRIGNLKIFNSFLDYIPSALTSLGFGLIGHYNIRKLGRLGFW